MTSRAPRPGRPGASGKPRVAAFVAAAPAVDTAARSDVLRLAAARLCDLPGGVLLATCHRVEVLVDAPTDPAAGTDLARAGMVALSGVEAARHTIGLALGLESAVVGEDQVLHQLRTAVAEARARGPLGPDHGLLLDTALRAGRIGRSWRPTDAGRHDRSLADLAVSRIAAGLGDLTGRAVLVVGTGEMGRAAVAALRTHGADIRLASRTAASSAALASELGVRPVDPDPGDELAATDAVLVALRGPWSLSPASEALLATRSLVVDLSMPSAMSPAVTARLGDRLLDIDRLAVASPVDGPGRRYRARLRDLADRTLAAYLADLEARRSSASDRLAARIERQRQAELSAYLQQRPDLDPAVRDELDGLTRDLSARLFREPLARLARDPDGRRRRALDELFGG